MSWAQLVAHVGHVTNVYKLESLKGRDLWKTWAQMR